jgi:tRNA dimethylallyltransferase
MRFMQMIDQGAIAEVMNIIEQPLSMSSMKAIGIKELSAFIRGDTSLDNAITTAQQLTRNYAKRQITWFKNQFFDSDNFASEEAARSFLEHELSKIGI